MHSSNNYRWHTATVMLGLVLSLVAAGAPAADDYLEILDAEAAETGNIGNPDDPVEAPRRKSIQPQRHITPGLGFDAFEEELRSRYAGTHLLYMKLSAASRRAAWKNYQQDNSLTSLRETIVSLMSSS